MAGISREMLSQLRHLLRPMEIRLANSIARAVVQVVDDSAKMQLLQLGVLDGEDADDGERFQEYGFTSVPLSGAEAVVIFPSGDREHPLVVAVDDRRHRPTGLQPGEVAVYNDAGAVIKLNRDGDIEVTPAVGRKILARSPGGTADALVTQTEFLRHTHATAATGPPVGPTPLAGGPLKYTKTLMGE